MNLTNGRVKERTGDSQGDIFEHPAASWDDIAGTNSLCDKKLVNGDKYSTEVVKEMPRFTLALEL